MELYIRVAGEDWGAGGAGTHWDPPRISGTPYVLPWTPQGTGWKRNFVSTH